MLHLRHLEIRLPASGLERYLARSFAALRMTGMISKCLAAPVSWGDRRIPDTVGKGYLKLRRFVMGEPSYFFYGGCV